VVVAAAVTHAHFHSGLFRRGNDAVGIGDGEPDRLFDQHGLPELDRLQYGLEVLALARRDEHRIDFGSRYDFAVFR
jgi:hypothetical protein